MYLIATPAGVPLNRWTPCSIRRSTKRPLRKPQRWRQLRRPKALADRIRKFQFRDIRPRAASDIGDLTAASKLLGHTEQQITRKVYIRVGETVKPTK